MRLGVQQPDMTTLLEGAGGRLLANGMALLLKLGFGYVLRNGLLDQEQSRKARSFFENNMVIHDPYAENSQRFYQGKFLIRTREPDDHMNVWLRFCPRPEDLYIKTPFGETLNPTAVIDAEALDEDQADAIAADPDKVDLIISFKDSKSILGLVGRQDIDIVGLLLENLVQLTGNVGHLFKLGAIAKSIETMVDIPNLIKPVDDEEFDDT
jgi:hypothetical protein